MQIVFIHAKRKKCSNVKFSLESFIRNEHLLQKYINLGILYYTFQDMLGKIKPCYYGLLRRHPKKISSFLHKGIYVKKSFQFSSELIFNAFHFIFYTSQKVITYFIFFKSNSLFIILDKIRVT